ncbi:MULTISPECIES: hypothetical protein [unclassified Campylobacter]|uniref:hypothetical protein n=1 Tax=unclassified Campylobacter TaxID=2593542 RepID=UPI001D4F8675|nr:hypothetical protein [Campylobacter sp. RM12651]MBZ7978523.1 hypothetical protein [Campylobacter sp. RM12654]MBZ7980440.1 hypothetical protein [Campylobacter sp. RM12642]MBZ7990599.1 hypothetical protein [Campylobacter sp. RM9331]MBZ8004762.1 hypothetical protein [Campylobacter sp. RM9332]MBZ8007121.1 hypothetical protein [Campylobacter sp. RM9334]
MKKYKILVALATATLFISCGEDINKPNFGHEYVSKYIKHCLFFQAKTDTTITSIVAEDGKCGLEIPINMHNFWDVSENGNEMIKYGYSTEFTDKGVKNTKSIIERKKIEIKLKEGEKFYFVSGCYPIKKLILETDIGKFEYKDLKKDDKK